MQLCISQTDEAWDVQAAVEGMMYLQAPILSLLQKCLQAQAQRGATKKPKTNGPQEAEDDIEITFTDDDSDIPIQQVSYKPLQHTEIPLLKLFRLAICDWYFLP